MGRKEGDLRSAASEAIRQFERMLVAEGVLLIKLWFHLSKKAAKQRFKTLESDPKTAWRVTPGDWERLKHYDGFVKVCEQALRRTSTGDAPWLVVEGADAAYRSLTVGQYILDGITQRLGGLAPARTGVAALSPPPLDNRSLLSSFDYSRALKEKTYDRQLETLQARLNGLTRDAAHARPLGGAGV
jgi:polyphosphate kinase 2 (PPK2 family)